MVLNKTLHLGRKLMPNRIDIKENDILELNPSLLGLLLKDMTTGKNILWGTDNYEKLGDGYKQTDQIQRELITGENGEVIKPRIAKSKEEQTLRSKTKAEVFTPSWVCNAQNNLIDEAWFGRKDVFNIEGDKTWEPNLEPIKFTKKKGKTWEYYVKANRMEVSCGEAPYLVSRYDTITGDAIPLNRRIGLLDRKLRVVSENCDTERDWSRHAEIAMQSVYGFEWQGDNLLLARENLLYTYIDFYVAKFQKQPSVNRLKGIARIIAWNLWQMDGLKGVVPYSCSMASLQQPDFFIKAEIINKPCVGCLKGDIQKHNGIYCKIMDWATGKPKKYISLLRKT